jgi:hypothetical protein
LQVSTKWGATVAATIALVVVAVGVVPATAAPGDPLNPQPLESAQPGSKGGFVLWDAATDALADGEPTRVYGRSDRLVASASRSGIHSEINVADGRPVTGNQLFDQVWRFVADPTLSAVAGGPSSWRAWAPDSATGPKGGTLTPDLTLDAFVDGPSGITDEIAYGGTYWYGVAYTSGAGATVVGAVYRQLTIQAGTGNYSVSPVMEEQPPPLWAPDFAAFPAAAGTYDLRYGNLEIDAGAANAGTTVDVWAEGTGLVRTGVVLDASGTAIVTSSLADGTRLAIASGNTVVAWATMKSFVQAQPAAGDPDEVHITVDAATMTASIEAGSAHATTTFRALAWPGYIDLGVVGTDAAGTSAVPLRGLPAGPHTLALVDFRDAVVAWGTVTVPEASPVHAMAAASSASGTFALEGVSASVELGEAKRGGVTPPKSLGPFTVTDDRSVRRGWTLTASVADFTGAHDDNIPAGALGLAPRKVGDPVAGITVSQAQPAGTASLGVIAQADPESTTTASGTQFDAELTFKAPRTAKAGTYTSTLTLTLATK